MTSRANFTPPPAWWRCALLAILPAAIVLALVALLFGAGPRQFLPLWSDEVVYWNEAAVFARAGFGGGYTVIQEEPARAAFSHFGPHGPVFPFFHGAIGRAFGWRAYSGFLVNLAVVSLAVFTWARGMPAAASPAAFLVVATFWPLLFYLPTNMQEPTHFAFAFLFALAIDRQLRGGPATHAWTALLVLAAVMIRPSWALLVLPLGWQRARRAGPWAILALLGVTGLATATAWGMFDALAAPSPHNTRALTRAWTESPATAMAALTELAARNLRQYVATEVAAPEIVLRAFIALFAGVLAVRWLIARPRDVTHATAIETALLIVLPILLVVVLVGEVESFRDFRVLAPHLLVALLVLVAHARWERWLWAATLVMLPGLYTEFVVFHQERFTAADDSIIAMRDATGPVMAFVPGAPPWTNTVTVHSDLLQFPLIAVPRGIGVSYVFDWGNLADPVRSRYLILRAADERQLQSRVRLTALATTPLGTLYRNDGPRGAASASGATASWR